MTSNSSSRARRCTRSRVGIDPAPKAFAFANAAFLSPIRCRTASFRHGVQPPPGFPARVAFGAARRGGCAAFLRTQSITQLFPFRRYDGLQHLPTKLASLASVSPMPVLILEASLRDRATLPSPLRGLVPSGGYPSPLRSLRSLRGPLARRFALLTAVSLPATAMRCSSAAVHSPWSTSRSGATRRARSRLRLACPRRLRRHPSASR